MAVTVCKILMEHVQDTASIEAAMEKEKFGADDIIAIAAKTEGNGGVNDFGRILVDRMLRDFLVAKGTRGREGAMKVPIALSGGCPGIIAPHLNIFANVEDPNPDPEAERLAVGIAMSEPMAPEDIGRPSGVEKVAAGTRLAMAAAGIDDPADIHYVQSKSPLLTTESIADAKSRGFSVCTEETIESMSFANATAALGIGVALGEFPMPREDQIGRDLDVYSSVASCSSGNEQVEAQIIVVGNKKGAGGRFRIGHSVMKDAIDTHGIYDAIRNAGLPLSDRPRPSDLGDAVVNCFVKCETDPRGLLRGHRLVSLNDTDVHHTHQTKAAVGGVAAAAIGDPAVFVSVAALQQGPAGGGMVAAIIDMDKVPR
jgi:cyanuric acid amidohydrolase